MLGTSSSDDRFVGFDPDPILGKGLDLAVLLGLAAGVHFQNANTFRRDGNVQNALFWQMTWRIPAIATRYCPADQ